MSNMARRLIPIFVIFLAVLSSGSQVLAHTLSKDGNISAFLHIDPDDKPVPGKVNTIHFYFNDQDFRFSMAGCLCNASVMEGSKVLYKGVLPADDLRVGKIKVFLPDNDVSYDVALSGKPKAAGYFQQFKLEFGIDVGKPPPKEPAKRNIWPLVMVGVLIAAAVTTGFYTLKRRSKMKAPRRNDG